MITYNDRVVSDHNIMLGKAVIKGTRITIDLILKKLGQGATFNELMEAYPKLTREDIYAALMYAADLISNEDILLPKE